MIHFRQIKYIIGVISLILIVIWATAVYSVNKRFPNATTTYYTKENPVLINGLQITPLEKRIYSPDEFKKNYPDCSKYTYIYEKDNYEKKYKIIVFEVKLYNTTDKEIKFNAQELNAKAKESGWNNGLTSVDSNFRPIVPAHIEENVMLTTSISTTLVQPKFFYSIEQEQFSLVISFYPESRILLFE